MNIQNRGASLSDPLDGHPWNGSVHRQHTLYLRLVKPAADRVLGAILLVLTSPVLAASAVLVRVNIGRPVIHAQTRIGLGGRPFRLYKLRTMEPDRRRSQVDFGSRDRRVNHKSLDDPRHTRVGRLLRSTRLDELPQLWNVVKGDMSLVGPRPELSEIVRKYEPWQHERHLVKPGVTGLWQISDQNGKPMHECTEIDIEYLNRMSFAEDVRILIRTPLAMLGRRRGH
jgi:lipopolysaccharide/colanic/teichoic acid biosynthesis glycosyltransferase